MNQSTGVVKTYCPELNQPKPKAQMFSDLSHSGKHYYLYSKVKLEESRSIRLVDMTKHSKFFPDELCYCYKVTRKEYENLKKTYVIGRCELLD